MFTGLQNFEHFTSDLVRDLRLIAPELILCALIPFLLLLRLFRFGSSVNLCIPSLIFVAISVVFAITADVPSPGGTEIFGGMLVADHFGLTIRVALLAFLMLAIFWCTVTGVPDSEDTADFLTLMIGATIGLMLMASSRHLLMVFIAMEMASLPSYALAAFHKGKRIASEAALKYVIFGAASSGTMLFGVSLVVGHYGTGQLSVIVDLVNYTDGVSGLAGLAGTLLIFVGLLFKLSAFPLHFWCPDVFTGASAEIGAFLSVASKAASLALAARILFALAGHRSPYSNSLALTWGLLAAITMTWGNLGAFGQKNIKRMLAYSTVAHAGLMMMALTQFDYNSVTPLLYYIVAYLFTNFGAFCVVAMVRNATGSEEVDAYDGLFARSQILGLTMSIFMFSLLGLPPLAGFAAKFQIFAHLFENSRKFEINDVPAITWAYVVLLVIAALNTAISAGYYLGLVRRIFLESSTQAHRLISIPVRARILLVALVGMIFALGVLWNPLDRQGALASKSFQFKSAKQQLKELEKQ